MARKGNQQKNGLSKGSANHKKGVSDHGSEPLTAKDRGHVKEETVGLDEQLPNGSLNKVEKKSKKKSKKSQGKEKRGVDEAVTDEAVPCNDDIKVDKDNIPTTEASNTRDGSCDMSPNDVHSSNNSNSFGESPHNGLDREDGLEDMEFPETVIFKYLRTKAFSVAKASAEWVERHEPEFVIFKNNALGGRGFIRMKIQQAQPVIYRWIMHIGNIMLLLFMVWLDCTLRGVDSFLCMGTTSFFTIVWCSVLSVTAMVGIAKSLIVLALAAAVGLFLGFTLAIVLTGIAGMIFLWFYGSFWTTGIIMLLGGLAFMTSHDRVALFITSVYSIYCAWNYVGGLGLLLGLNLSFISSDALLYFLRNIINEQRTANSSPGQVPGQPPFSHSETVNASSTETDAAGARAPADRSSGVPSTSGSESEITSEDEIVRLLNSADHYAALGLSRFENIDVAVIKKEYRKKAMLVHPDKNMGYEKAAEAFKKLQNAYEVLLDSVKRKEYNDELRREELLNYFRKYQNVSHENIRNGLFKSGFAWSEADSEDLLGESRRIACKTCGFFHIWMYTNKIKSRARWCQECKDFHQAKDGDGWVEQFSQPLLFGILQQVEAPSAYVCANGKVYNATEWFTCQGMRCPANTHKPTFHVNTNVVSKNGQSKGSSSGQKPAPNMEETMTEEEFFEWLQNAMQSGMFENFPGTSTSENPSGFSPKGGGGGSNSSGGSSKRKKKGKKQW